MTCGGENGTNGNHLAIFSEDVAFAHHFVAPAHYIGYTSKKLSEMVENGRFSQRRSHMQSLHCVTDKHN